MNPLTRFDRIYCIHYPNEERAAEIAKEFDRVGISPRYIHARGPHVDFHVTNMRRNPRIEFACGMSHIKAVVASIGHDRPLFLEDDITFADGWRDRLEEALQIIPSNWDVLYLGGHPREPVAHVSGCLYRARTFSCAEGYAFNNGAQARFHEYWCDRIARPKAMYDFILGEFAARNNAYAIYPTVTNQRTCYSLIKNDIDEKTALVERGWVNNGGKLPGVSGCGG